MCQPSISVFKTVPLSLRRVGGITVAIAAVVFVAVEVEKWVKRRAVIRPAT